MRLLRALQLYMVVGAAGLACAPRSPPYTAADYVRQFGTCDDSWVAGHGIEESWRSTFEQQLSSSPPGTTDMDAMKQRIRERITERADSILECYNHGLRVWHSKGRTVIRFIIAADGRVVRAKIAENTMPREIACCVQNSVRSWTFVPWQEGITFVTYPFVFEIAADDQPPGVRCDTGGQSTQESAAGATSACERREPSAN